MTYDRFRNFLDTQTFLQLRFILTLAVRNFKIWQKIILLIEGNKLRKEVFFMRNLFDMITYLFLIAIPEFTFATLMTLIVINRTNAIMYIYYCPHRTFFNFGGGWE